MTSLYSVVTTPTFEREFRKRSRNNPETKDLLDDMLEILKTDPQNISRLHNIRKLSGVKSGYGQYRIRQGDWRLRYDIEENSVVLLYFRHRKEAYR